jgi:hypothetical protein
LRNLWKNPDIGIGNMRNVQLENIVADDLRFNGVCSV